MMAPIILSPHAHQLNSHGNDCLRDCPACLWARENEWLITKILRLAANRTVTTVMLPNLPQSFSGQGHVSLAAKQTGMEAV
jgi:hypothetical protein